jgi:lipopolysaccharide/colanic/teichoic acid biosynthesis glycosyltransferase
LGKPVLDRLGAVIIGLAALPIAALIALVVRVTLGSPVLYVRERVGQHGRRFWMFKFRTMRTDQRREQRPFSGPDRRVRHKTATDPRHTGVGMFLRRRSLDEIPQLLNVVLGHMSLVGPRPELPSVVAGYGPWQHERHLCKPGVTGLWQVSARNTDDGSLMCEHTEVDLEYLRVMSLRTDLAILWKTLGVLGGGG